MSKARIHFRNKPFMARVTGKGDEPIECTPVVYDEMTNCGVGIFYEDGHGQVWGMVMPRNLISAWRGTEVLRHLNIIEHGTLCAAYYTGLRNPHESDMKSHVEPTIAKIGREVYTEIMRMPVPESIIQAILAGNEDDSEVAEEGKLIMKPDLYPITDEVRAGTIAWREEFAKFGIKHPDDVDAKKRAQEETVAKFEKLLASYAKSRNLPRECNGMWNVEGALLTLVDKGADQNHSDYVLVALAGIVGELAVSEFSMSILPFGPGSREGYDAQMDKTKKSAIEHSAKWLASSSGHQCFAFWRSEKKSFTPSSARELLQRLLVEYFPPKAETTPA